MIGKTISHYRITAKLGEGGMGVVYRAEDEKLRRSVALKFLAPELTPDARARQRLLREARVASRLNHPNIATIYEVGEADDTPYIAMEFVEGETLKDILQRGVLDASRLLDIARPIAEGLNEAHQAGVLHRDMKPGNIMIDSKQRLKILDFGLAVLIGRERKPEETAETFATRTVAQWSTGGTVPYMSPEQLSGEKTDARGDIFSFGVLLYECLTGRLPFRGKTSVDIMHAILHQPLTPLADLIPDISPQWERLVGRCLAKDRSKRFRSMQEVLENFPLKAARTTRAEKSVAVLYFENLSSSKDDDYFRDGMTEDVIMELLKIKELRVFPRSAVLAYRDNPVPAPQIGRELDAQYVLEGSLRRAGNRLRITAQLVETRTSHSVWAERYDRQLEDVFEIQDEIAQNIARALRVMLSEKEKRAIQKTPTVNVEAYDYYLRGRQYFYQFRRADFERARKLFIRAYELDSQYAHAYAGVADCRSFTYTWFDASEANLKEANEASHKALELDPDLAEAHVSRGMALSLSKQYDQAQKEFETAIRQNPELFEAYYFYARACFSEGKLEQAGRLLEKACRLRPEDYYAPSLLGLAYVGLERQADAEVAYRRSLQAAERHLELFPEDARALYLGALSLIRTGDRRRGLQWADRALTAEPEEPFVFYNVACTYALVGEVEKAINSLDEAITFGMGQREWFENDPDLNSLRDDPRFQALLERL